ncbi:MAG: NAD(P)/FAD-dependent oxidoreductase [Oscillospiraceae bacterium]|nr:NAD(P)/FAD-dependent oxidoreductase [Oscillospiraceae bacterium]
MNTVIIIGVGAAGLIACGTAAKTADKVILIERNDILGKKLLITGKGRCNITNTAELEDIIAAYPTNGKFLYSAIYTFTNDDIINLIEDLGVKTKAERGGRVFPVSDKAADVVKAMKKYALRDNVSLITERVRNIIIKDGAVAGVETASGKIDGNRVIVCTGGKSYPKTGSTGDGYIFARQAGHTVVEPKPSLVPITVEEKWARELMGLSLRNVSITAFNEKNKKVYSDFGEMLFTHFGISGPIVLSMSAHLRRDERYRLEIDLKPALDAEQLDARLVRDFEKYSKKHIINSMDDLLPRALIPVVIELSGIEEHRCTGTITRGERMKIAELLKHLPLTFKGFRPIDEAIVTSGGVKVSEINPSTMESKKVSGLYFAGEVIDVDGYTGGYNLQAAWSTGYLAGMSAAE